MAEETKSATNEFLITGAGAGLAIFFPGGDGTVSLSPTDASAFRQIGGTPPPVAGPGDWNGATVVFEASFNGLFTDSFRPMVDSLGVQLLFAENGTESKNFSAKACYIRPIVTGTPNGIGLLLSIKGRGQ